MFRTPVVKIHKITTGTTFGADEVLLKQVSRGLQLQRTERQKCDVVVLFCPITSRVGTDVQAAMSEVSGDEKILLVLMHHTRDANYATAGLKWSKTYGNIILDVHVLFHESMQGLLNCSKNGDGVCQIQDALRPHSSGCSFQFWKTWPIKRWLIFALTAGLVYYIYKRAETNVVSPKLEINVE